MKKLNTHTPDITAENIAKITALFPQVATEKEGDDGVMTRAIDFDLLRQELSGALVEDDSERYRLDWPGKKASLLKANTPITSTLRPDRDSSVNFDTTENVFIEGDNFEVLKVLQESYLGKVKMVYIDPPYNTGKDFVYRDNRTVSKEDYEEELGVEDEGGGKLFRNTDTNGRFHSDWLSMMHERLIVARDLLKEDGVLFASIDNNEVTNLRKICDELFGEANFVGTISRMMKSGGNKGQFFSPNMEYIIVYAKNILSLQPFRLPLEQELIDKVYTKIENEGEKKGQYYREMGLYQAGLDIRPNQKYWIKCPDGSLALPPGNSKPIDLLEGAKIKPNDSDGVWRWIYERFVDEKNKGNIVFKETSTSSLVDEKGNQSKWNIYTKIWLNDRLEDGRVPTDLITKFENRLSSAELKELDIPFDFAKPAALIKYLISFLDMHNELVLDFFAGSGTTAHAVMDLNVEDGENRKFIMVQIPEETDKESEAFKAGYKTISEISMERIRRAGKKILEENIDKLKERGRPLDIGFRVYKADSTNMKDVYYHPSQIAQDDLFNQVSNIKEDRNPEDLLTQVILKLGLTLDLPVEKKKIKGNDVYFVAGNALVACFDDKIDFGIIDDIAKIEPLKVVFKDASFKEEQDRTNLDTRFKRLSPETIITVL